MLASASAQPFTVEELNLIEEGFNIFNNETFAGNGRTCGTCHIGEKRYNITPDDIAQLSPEKRFLVFATNVPALENPTLVEKLALFNINEEHAPGNSNEPEGPFRASMTIAGLGLTSLNNFVCRSAVDGGLPQTAGCTVGNNTLPPTFEHGASGPITTTNGNGAVDDGTRDREIGWGGDGALADPDIFPDIPASQDCRDAIEEFNADPKDLGQTLRSFSLAAVKTHFPRTLNRVPGTDFRCPTPEELDALAAFQQWLGRRFELDLAQITFVKDRKEKGDGPGLAEEGKALFMDRRAACNACHVNAGASDTQGRVKLGPVPVLPPDPPVPFTLPLTLTGANKNSRTGIDFLRERGVDLELLTAPVEIPRDAGDKTGRGGATDGVNIGVSCAPAAPGCRQGGFNVQSLIEAARKGASGKGGAFFHNNAIRTTIEGAIGHYFTAEFDLSQGGTAIRGADFRAGLTGPQTLAALGGPEALNKMGFFLRALSAVYSLADCERLVEEMVERVNLGLSPDLPSLHCEFALNDVRDVLKGSKVSLRPYSDSVGAKTSGIKSQLKEATRLANKSKQLQRLQEILESLHDLRLAIASTPELP
jgi:hypothetical protein